MRELVEREGVSTVLGAVSSTVTLRLAPYCERNHVVLISPSASAPQLTEAGSTSSAPIRRTFSKERRWRTFARDLGLDRVAVLAVDNDYGASLARAFAERLDASGGSVVASLTFPEGDADGDRGRRGRAAGSGSAGRLHPGVRRPTSRPR